MSEKIKGVFASETKFRELICWLRSQGAVESSLVTLVTIARSAIYYVNKQGQVMHTDKIHADLFDLVELPRWRAEYDKKYYFVSECGKTRCSSDIREALDDERFNLGNYFKTREEAELYAKKVREIYKVIENAEETR